MADATTSPFDQALVSLAELVAGFGPDEGEFVPEAAPGRMWVERVTLDLPVEIEVTVDVADEVRLGSAPPTQQIATSIMPVLHRLRIGIVRNAGHAE